MDGDHDDMIAREHFDDMVPADGVPILGLRLVVWMDADGDQMSHYEVEGSCRFDQIMGQIESMKLRMFCNQYDVVTADEEEE